MVSTHSFFTLSELVRSRKKQPDRNLLSLSGLSLNPLGIIQRNPSVTIFLIRFQKPPKARALAFCFFHNSESTFSRVLTCFIVVCSRPPADVQIFDGYSHKIRCECSIGINHFTGFIKYGISPTSDSTHT